MSHDTPEYIVSKPNTIPIEKCLHNTRFTVTPYDIQYREQALNDRINTLTNAIIEMKNQMDHMKDLLYKLSEVKHVQFPVVD